MKNKLAIISTIAAVLCVAASGDAQRKTYHHEVVVLQTQSWYWTFSNPPRSEYGGIWVINNSATKGAPQYPRCAFDGTVACKEAADVIADLLDKGYRPVADSGYSSGSVWAKEVEDTPTP